MSDPRPLSAAERTLIDELIRRAGLVNVFDGQTKTLKATSLDDGGMGSLRLGDPSDSRRMSEQVAELSFDDGGVPVSAALLLDQDGGLFELDLFKVDFSPLGKLPDSFD